MRARRFEISVAMSRRWSITRDTERARPRQSTIDRRETNERPPWQAGEPRGRHLICKTPLARPSISRTLIDAENYIPLPRKNLRMRPPSPGTEFENRPRRDLKTLS